MEKTGFKTAYIEKSRVDEAQRLVTGWASTCEVDECGDVMIPQGVDTTYLDRIKSINVDHRRGYEYQIASHRWAKVHDDKGVMVQFKMGSSPVANLVWDAMQEKIINSLSIEFMSTDFGPPTASERAKYGRNAQTMHRKWRLNSYAVLSQPMNSGAGIIEMKSRPIVDWLGHRVRSGKVTVDLAKSLGWGQEAVQPRLVLIPNGWVLRATP